MRTVRIFLPGNFEDAQVYMGWLILLTTDRTLQSFRMTDIVGHIESKSSDLAPLPTLMFLHNDWLATEQFRAFHSNDNVRNAILSLVDRFPQPWAEIETRVLNNQKGALAIQASVILDMIIYGRRFYFGCDTGFYHLDPSWDDNFPTMQARPERRMDARCVGASAAFGAVNASCGKDGLFCATDEFGWLEHPNRHVMEKAADASIRTSWFGFDLVNYSKRDFPVLLRSSHERLQGGRHPGERSVLTKIGTERIGLGFLLEHLSREHGFSGESIQYTYNSNRVMFINTYEGQFYSMGVKTTRRGQLNVDFTKTYKGAGTRVLDAHSFLSGVVIETDSRVFAFINGDWTLLLDAEALTVRTFPHSRNYKNLVTITTEAGVYLVSVFDESQAFPKKNDQDAASAVGEVRNEEIQY